MFKFNIDKKAIESLIEVLKDNNLSEIEIKDGNKSIKIDKEGVQLKAMARGGDTDPAAMASNGH